MNPAIRALHYAYKAYPRLADVIKTKTATLSMDAFKAAGYRLPSSPKLKVIALVLSGASCSIMFDKTFRCEAPSLAFPQTDWIIHYLINHPELNKSILLLDSLPDLCISIGNMLGDKTIPTEETLKPILKSIWETQGLNLDTEEDIESFELLLDTVIQCQESYRIYPMKHQERDEEAYCNRF